MLVPLDLEKVLVLALSAAFAVRFDGSSFGVCSLLFLLSRRGVDVPFPSWRKR